MALINLEEAIEALHKCNCISDNAVWHTEDPPNREANYLVTDNEGNLDICLWTNDFFTISIQTAGIGKQGHTRRLMRGCACRIRTKRGLSKGWGQNFMMGRSGY